MPESMEGGKEDDEKAIGILDNTFLMSMSKKID